MKELAAAVSKGSALSRDLRVGGRDMGQKQDCSILRSASLMTPKGAEWGQSQKSQQHMVCPCKGTKIPPFLNFTLDFREAAQSQGMAGSPPALSLESPKGETEHLAHAEY